MWVCTGPGLTVLAPQPRAYLHFVGDDRFLALHLEREGLTGGLVQHKLHAAKGTLTYKRVGSSGVGNYAEPQVRTASYRTASYTNIASGYPFVL